MKKLLLLTLASLSLATACKKKDSEPAVMQLSGTMNAAQEVPAISTSTATATVTGTYNPSTKLLTYSIAYSGLTPNAGHIHYGDPRHSNPAGKFVLFSDPTHSPITGSATLTSMQADSLLAGHTYTNLHTIAYPAGEIRANLTVK
jgi:hypothetical protein